MIFQLQDDHSRLAVASLVARAETSDAAVRVFDKGVRAYGVPQRLLTDNGASLNPTRRGRQGRLVDHVRALGVEPITGKPYKPTTHGAGTSGLPGVSRTVVDCVGQAALLLLTKSCSASLGVRYPSAE